MPMNPDVKQAWLEALRGDTYQQTVAKLRSFDRNYQVEGFCCLGVLCDLHAKAGLGAWEFDAERVKSTYEKHGDTLPSVVMLWAGLTEPNPHVIAEGYQRTLASLNDAGVSFAEIADLIEGNL